MREIFEALGAPSARAAMTMSIALDYAPRGIRVNCVCPAAIENTRMDAISAPRAPNPQQRLEYLLAKHRIGRWVSWHALVLMTPKRWGYAKS
jgi:NAD(P)-dependent dehydrogenase (short-subunit alcohol dehydrogenase family)